MPCPHALLWRPLGMEEVAGSPSNGGDLGDVRLFRGKFGFWKGEEKEGCIEKEGLGVCPDGAELPSKGAADGVPCGSEGQDGWEPQKLGLRGRPGVLTGGWSFVAQVMLPPLASVAGLPTSLDAPGIPASVWSRYGHSQLIDEEITTGKFLSLAGRG